jgi:hypothetical protein
MIEILDQLAAPDAGNGPAIFRSLFLWQQILGSDSGAAIRLRQATIPLIRLPPGAEVTPVLIAVHPNPTGFDLQEAALPGADAVFAYVAEQGLRLSGSVDPAAGGATVRRLQVIDAAGRPYRRHGGERFMLRYRLPPPAVGAEQLMFVVITAEPAPSPAPRPRLHVWVELEHDGARHFILPDDNRTCPLGADTAIQMISFPPGAIARHTAAQGTAFLSIELLGDPVDIGLLGEALIVGR